MADPPTCLPAVQWLAAQKPGPHDQELVPYKRRLVAEQTHVPGTGSGVDGNLFTLPDRALDLVLANHTLYRGPANIYGTGQSTQAELCFEALRQLELDGAKCTCTARAAPRLEEIARAWYDGSQPPADGCWDAGDTDEEG